MTTNLSLADRYRNIAKNKRQRRLNEMKNLVLEKILAQTLLGNVYLRVVVGELGILEENDLVILKSELEKEENAFKITIGCDCCIRDDDCYCSLDKMDIFWPFPS